MLESVLDFLQFESKLSLVKSDIFFFFPSFVPSARSNQLHLPSAQMSATARVTTMMSLCQAWPSPLRLKTSSMSKRWARGVVQYASLSMPYGKKDDGSNKKEDVWDDFLEFCVCVEVQQWLVDRTPGERRLWNRFHPQSSEAWKHSYPPGAESQAGQVPLQVNRLVHTKVLCFSFEIIYYECAHH